MSLTRKRTCLIRVEAWLARKGAYLNREEEVWLTRAGAYLTREGACLIREGVWLTKEEALFTREGVCLIREGAWLREGHFELHGYCIVIPPKNISVT